MLSDELGVGCESCRSMLIYTRVICSSIVYHRVKTKRLRVRNSLNLVCVPETSSNPEHDVKDIALIGALDLQRPSIFLANPPFS